MKGIRKPGRLPRTCASRLMGLTALMLMLAACSSSGGSSASSPTPGSSVKTTPSGPPAISVTSTLDGHTALPHRIHWEATPTPTDVSEVDFLIDGKQMWVEEHPPYDYGDDGNYLVTSFLKPGKHEFTVRAIGLEGQTAKDSVTATVPKAPSPPAALAGSWNGFRPPSPDGAPGGTWQLVINKVGWRIYEPKKTGANLIDVAYLSRGLVEIRTGMATGHDERASPGQSDFDLNGWCNNEPGSPARYRWSVNGTHLSLKFAGGHPCEGFTKFLTDSWTRSK